MIRRILASLPRRLFQVLELVALGWSCYAAIIDKWPLMISGMLVAIYAHLCAEHRE